MFGWQAAAEQMLTIDQTVETHCAALAQQLRAGLRNLPGVTLLGPNEPAQTTGLIGFTIEGWRAEQCKALVDSVFSSKEPHSH